MRPYCPHDDPSALPGARSDHAFPESETAGGEIAASEKGEEFIRLLTTSYSSIYAYTRTLISNAADAEDCMQDAILQLWRKFDEFDRGGSFSRWARGFVRRIVKNHHRKLRPRYLALDDDLIDRLATVQGGVHELLELRRQQLSECLAKLPPADRALIGGYYKHGESVTELSRQIGRTPAAIYQALRRARLMLFRCVDRHLGKEE